MTSNRKAEDEVPVAYSTDHTKSPGGAEQFTHAAADDDVGGKHKTEEIAPDDNTTDPTQSQDTYRASRQWRFMRASGDAIPSAAGTDTVMGDHVRAKLKVENNSGKNDTSNDADSESDVDFIIRDIKDPKTIINPVRNKDYLDLDGIDGLSINGPLLDTLFHTRHADTVEESYEPVVLKNVIAIFQGYVLFEDCLDVGYRKKILITSLLQQDLGYTVRDEDDNTVVHFVTSRYKEARIRYIMSQLALGKLPQDPPAPRVALLLRLIDQTILFDHSGRPVRERKDRLHGPRRVAARRCTIQTALATAATTEPLFWEFAAIVPPDMRRTESHRLWEIQPWVKKQKAAIEKKHAQARKLEEELEAATQENVRHALDGTGPYSMRQLGTASADFEDGHVHRVEESATTTGHTIPTGGVNVSTSDLNEYDLFFMTMMPTSDPVHQQANDSVQPSRKKRERKKK